MVCQTGLHFDLPVAFVVMEQMGWLTFDMCLAFGKTFDSHCLHYDLHDFVWIKCIQFFVKFLIVLNAHGQLCADG